MRNSRLHIFVNAGRLTPITISGMGRNLTYPVGSADQVAELIEKIGAREDVGDLLAEGMIPPDQIEGKA